MKVVFYSQSTTLYGAPTSLLNLIQGITSSRNDLDISVVIPSEGPLTTELRKLPLQIICIPFYKWVYNKALYEKKKAKGPVIAHLWFVKNAGMKMLLNLFWLPVHLLRIRRISPDMIYTNSSLSPMGVIVAHLLGIRSAWHHRETINDAETNFFLEWNKGITLRILNWPAIHFHPSRYLKQSYDPYVNSGMSYVVYNGVAESEQTGFRVAGDPPLVFGMVGRVSRQKGQREVIEAFRHFHSDEVQLNIYGSGEKYYVDQMKGASGDNIHFMGFQPKEEIYTQIDFLVMNARNESFGRVVAEAYAHGVPVIALRSGAVPELIDEEETGYLFDQIEELTEIIVNLIAQKAFTYTHLKENCVQKFRATFTLEIYCRNILKVVDDHVNPKKK